MALFATLVIALNVLIAPLFRSREHKMQDIARAEIVVGATFTVAILGVVVAVASFLKSGPDEITLESLTTVTASAVIALVAVDLGLAIPDKLLDQLGEALTTKRLGELRVAHSYWADPGLRRRPSVLIELGKLFASLGAILVVPVGLLLVASSMTSASYALVDCVILAAVVAFVYLSSTACVAGLAIALARHDVTLGCTWLLGLFVLSLSSAFGAYSFAYVAWISTPFAGVLATLAMLAVVGVGSFALVTDVRPECDSPWLRSIRMSALRAAVVRDIEKSIVRLEIVQNGGRDARTRASLPARIMQHLYRAAGQTVRD